MAKPSTNSHTGPLSSATTISKDIPQPLVSRLAAFFDFGGVSNNIPSDYTMTDLYSDLLRGLLKVHCIQHGRITCILSVKPAVTSPFGGLHGRAVAAVAEMVSIACARTVVAKDKELFLGQLSISYLIAAPRNVELIVDGSVVRSGRNVTVTAVEFKLKKTGQLAYTARATFYNMPVSNL